jgi:hypothetical protein
MAGPELWEAMDLGYLTGQRPADVIAMRIDVTTSSSSRGKQGEAQDPDCARRKGKQPGRLVREISERNAAHPSKYLLINKHGKG